MDNKEAVLGDEDLVTVSYMAEELDLETVGDIIAIIEEKVNSKTSEIKLNSIFTIISIASSLWESGLFKLYRVK